MIDWTDLAEQDLATKKLHYMHTPANVLHQDGTFQSLRLYNHSGAK